MSGHARCSKCGSGQIGLFFGQWVPTQLLFGLYNKIVKVAGTARAQQDDAASGYTH